MPFRPTLTVCFTSRVPRSWKLAGTSPETLISYTIILGNVIRLRGKWLGQEYTHDVEDPADVLNAKTTVSMETTGRRPLVVPLTGSP